MDYITHSIAGVVTAGATGLLANKIGIQLDQFAMIAGGLVGGLICDIDTPTSFIGSKTRPLSDILFEFVGHRTFTHSILFLVLLGGIVGLFNVNLGIGLALGIASHIILDMLTPNTNGTCLYYPFIKKRIKIFKNSGY